VFCEYQQCENTMFSQAATEPWMANWQRLRTVIHISQNTNITS